MLPNSCPIHDWLELLASLPLRGNDTPGHLLELVWALGSLISVWDQLIFAYAQLASQPIRLTFLIMIPTIQHLWSLELSIPPNVIASPDRPMQWSTFRLCLFLSKVILPVLIADLLVNVPGLDKQATVIDLRGDPSHLRLTCLNFLLPFLGSCIPFILYVSNNAYLGLTVDRVHRHLGFVAFVRRWLLSLG